jgi:hypothetical protein
VARVAADGAERRTGHLRISIADDHRARRRIFHDGHLVRLAAAEPQDSTGPVSISGTGRLPRPIRARKVASRMGAPAASPRPKDRERATGSRRALDPPSNQKGDARARAFRFFRVPKSQSEAAQIHALKFELYCALERARDFERRTLSLTEQVKAQKAEASRAREELAAEKAGHELELDCLYDKMRALKHELAVLDDLCESTFDVADEEEDAGEAVTLLRTPSARLAATS